MGVQGFQGVDYSTKDRSSGPVQFEQDPAEADPFGLDQMLSKVGSTPWQCTLLPDKHMSLRTPIRTDFLDPCKQRNLQHFSSLHVTIQVPAVIICVLPVSGCDFLMHGGCMALRE